MGASGFIRGWTNGFVIVCTKYNQRDVRFLFITLFWLWSELHSRAWELVFLYVYTLVYILSIYTLLFPAPYLSFINMKFYLMGSIHIYEIPYFASSLFRISDTKSYTVCDLRHSATTADIKSTNARIDEHVSMASSWYTTEQYRRTWH